MSWSLAVQTPLLTWSNTETRDLIEYIVKDTLPVSVRKIFLSLSLSLCMCVCVYVCMQMCMYFTLCVCACAHAYAYVCVCTSMQSLKYQQQKMPYYHSNQGQRTISLSDCTKFLALCYPSWVSLSGYSKQLKENYLILPVNYMMHGVFTDLSCYKRKNK